MSAYNNNEAMIDAYLSGDLLPEVRQAFENEIEESPELQAELAFQQRIQVGIRAYALEQEWGDLQHLLSDYEYEAPVKFALRGQIQRLGKLSYYLIAASILLLISIGLRLDTFETIELIRTDLDDPTMSSEQNVTEYPLQLKQGVERMESQRPLTPSQCQEVLQLFAPYLEDENLEYRNIAVLHTGMIFLKYLDQPETAIPYFEQMAENYALQSQTAKLKSKEKNIYAGGRWALAYGYWQSGNKALARQKLAEVSQDTLSPYHQKAENLIRQSQRRQFSFSLFIISTIVLGLLVGIGLVRSRNAKI